MANAETSFVCGKKIPKIFRKIKNWLTVTKDEFEKERAFGRVAKIPISDTFDELVGMDFVDYGGGATFLHIRDTFSRFACIIFREQRKGRTNGGNG